jgi:hypothetical protein
MTYGCSIPSAFIRHEQNGARRLTDNKFDTFVPLIKIPIPKSKKHKHFLKSICSENEIPIYWVKHIGN